MPDSLTIVIATYNERQTLPSLVTELLEWLPHARILVVDDNSPDGTGEWVTQFATNESRIDLHHRDIKEGLGAASIDGLKVALSGCPDWIATMDADHSHRPQDLKQMWAVASADTEVDVIIGSRYVKGGRIENWSGIRRVASRCVNLFARWALWLRSRDNSGALRIYRSDSLRKIELQSIDCRGFAYLEQILFHLQKAECHFREVPIVFTEREKGTSKVSLSELCLNLRDILWLAIRRS